MDERSASERERERVREAQKFDSISSRSGRCVRVCVRPRAIAAGCASVGAKVRRRHKTIGQRRALSGKLKPASEARTDARTHKKRTELRVHRGTRRGRRWCATNLLALSVFLLLAPQSPFETATVDGESSFACSRQRLPYAEATARQLRALLHSSNLIQAVLWSRQSLAAADEQQQEQQRFQRLATMTMRLDRNITRGLSEQSE